MNKSTLALAVAVGVLAQQAGAAGFIEDSKASVSSRTMYYNDDNRDGPVANGSRERPLKASSSIIMSGFTQGTVGFGIDAQALVGIHLDGGKGHHPAQQHVLPKRHRRFGCGSSGAVRAANVKARFSKTEAAPGWRSATATCRSW